MAVAWVVQCHRSSLKRVSEARLEVWLEKGPKSK